VYEKVQLKPYLKAGLLVQSDHPTIKALAHEIVNGARGYKAKARLIFNWVYESLDKRATVSVPNALDTLKARAGDCNEHAVLFAALLRAAGVPAKVCAGLVYTRGQFYYHAWNEVFLDEWTTADALMGQMPADVTHIKFVEGGLDRQADMVRVIGRIKLTVLEAR
jgi:transglutaminase-like putative cysteine protease